MESVTNSLAVNRIVKIEENWPSLNSQRRMWSWLFGKKEPVVFPEQTDYMGAGCVFTNGRVILGAVHQTGMISGIGGHRERTDVDYVQTAHREFLEEVFGVDAKDIPEALYTKLRTIQPLYIQEPSSAETPYVNIVYGFHALEKMMKYVRDHHMPTSMYRAAHPCSVSDLIFWRHYSEAAEIPTLVLLPVLPSLCTGNLIAPEFSEDVDRFEQWYLALEVRPYRSDLNPRPNFV